MKYRSASGGRLQVPFVSSWADRHGVHSVPMDKAEVDVLCAYCPDTDECYYVRPADHRRSVTLRITPAANGQRVGIWSASSFRRLVPPLRIAG